MSEPRTPGGGADGAAERILRELRESRESLRVTLSSIGDAVITTDAEGLVTFLNPVAEALTGWANADAAGKPLDAVFRIVNESTRATVQNPATRALREGVVVGLANHTLLIARDGAERPIDDSAAPIKDEAGAVSGVVLVFRDITERRAVEDAQRRSEVRYRRLFQTAKDGILILDARSGKIIDANAFMAGLLRMEPGGLIGKELWEIGLFADVGSNKEHFATLQRDRYARYEHLPLQNREGGVIHVEFVSNVYEEGEMLVAQCNVRDISARVAMEQRIRDQADALASQARQKDEFLAMLSHELRNPLAPIRSATHLLRLQGDGVDPLQRQALEVIDRQVAALTRLVSDLMEVSRALTGRIRISLQTVDLAQIIRHAAETVAPMIEQRGHTLTMRLSEGPVWVQADPTRIEEVAVNLLGNAAKYTDWGGRIELSCQAEADHAVVRVRDNGAGIEPALLPSIFDLFTQANRTLDRAQGGLGIGLSLSQRIVALHGGTIGASSDGPGKGSEFVVRLRLSAAPETSRAVTVRPDPGGEKPAFRVLVVDDNRDACMMLSGLLRVRGHETREAHSGAEALAAAADWRPDIVLLDIGLPEVDGYEVARRLRADESMKNVRLAAVTGYGSDRDMVLAREAGFDAHFTKPVDLRDVESALARWAESRGGKAS